MSWSKTMQALIAAVQVRPTLCHAGCWPDGCRHRDFQLSCLRTWWATCRRKSLHVTNPPTRRM